MLGLDFAYVSDIYINENLTSACFCIFLLCNYKRTDSGMSDVKRGSVCALVGYQWCGGLYVQALQFQQMAVRRKLPGGVGISHFGPN
jgi:hypothetical protein